MGSKLSKIGEIQAVYLITKLFRRRIKEIEDKVIQEAYTHLYRLFCLQRFEEYSTYVVSSRALSGEHFELFQNQKVQIYESLTPHGLKLAEGFPFTEKLLFSAIALENESPYENLYNWAKQYGRINQSVKVHPDLTRIWLPASKRLFNEALTAEERENQDKL